jgi:hypothetical protein
MRGTPSFLYRGHRLLRPTAARQRILMHPAVYAGAARRARADARQEELAQLLSADYGMSLSSLLP